MRNHTTAKNSAKSSIGVVCSELVNEPQGSLPGGVIKIYSTKKRPIFRHFYGRDIRPNSNRDFIEHNLNFSQTTCKAKYFLIL